MHTETLTARVYEADDLGGVDSPAYLWDFGSFTLVGTEDEPHQKFDGFYEYQASMNKLDVQWRDAQEYQEKDVVFYAYDYGIYCEVTTLENPRYFFDGDSVLKVSDSVPLQDDEHTEIVILTEASPSSARFAMSKDDIQSRLDEEDWLSLTKIGN